MSANLPPPDEAVPEFDYDEPAELYFPLVVGRRGGLDYRRFPRAALALQYAIESVSAKRLGSATLEVAGIRYNQAEMVRLYHSYLDQQTSQPQ